MVSRTATYLLFALARCSTEMPTGKVKWFNPAVGYGLIRPDDGGDEVLVHISAVKKAGLGSLSEGDHLSYDLVNRLGKEAAQNLRVAMPTDARRPVSSSLS